MKKSLQSGRAMPIVRIWLTAGVLTAAVVLVLAHAGHSFHSRELGGLRVPEIAFVGTSLMDFAVPPRGPASDYLSLGDPDDRSVRLTRTGGLDGDVHRLARACVDAGVRVTVVQVEPFLLRFDVGESLPRATRFADDLRAGLRWILGRRPPTPADVIEAEAGQDRQFDGVMSEVLPENIDVRVFRNGGELKRLINDSKAGGRTLVFVAMPRAESAARALGESFEQTFRDNLRWLEREFGAEVWRPAVFWPDDHFWDQAHLNRRGRARFVKSIQERLAGLAPDGSEP